MRSLRSVLPYLFESAVAVSWTVVGVQFLVDPTTAERSPVGAAVHPFDTMWSVGYVVGGPLALFGLLRRRPRWRVPGLILLSCGLVMQGIAAVTFAWDLRDLVYFIYATACGARAGAVWRFEVATMRSVRSAREA